MFTLSAIVAVASMAAVVVGDLEVAATITGVFAVLNTFLNTLILRHTRDVKRTIVAPRRAVYDSDGHIVGTVLALDWTHRMHRRLTDMGPLYEDLPREDDR